MRLQAEGFTPSPSKLSLIELRLAVHQRNFAWLSKPGKTNLVGFEGLQTLQNLPGRLLVQQNESFVGRWGFHPCLGTRREITSHFHPPIHPVQLEILFVR